MALPYSLLYPPRNRKESPELGIHVTEIVSMDGVIRIDDEVEPDSNDPVMHSICCVVLPLGAPVAPSVISGKPGYIYRTHEIELVLAKDELYRLHRMELRPDEFFALAERYGVFFEICDAFYNEETGEIGSTW